MGDALADLFPLGATGETLYPQRDEIRTLTGRRPRVGLSWWSGGKEGRRKSIPIERLASHLAALPAEFVNLQYGEEGARFAEFFGNKAAHSPRERASSLLADAEEIRSCDVVLTCSNTCAHLAGALGVPTLALIPKNNGRFWYWQANHEFCPWYPSIRLVEQTEDGDWEGALAHAKTLILAGPGIPAIPAAV
jgi:ADP-heptose:LPS heptosyltransferase